MFFIKCKNLDIRQQFIQYMREKGIICAFHYVPLHSSPAGLKFGRFNGKDTYTTSESDRLVRLPLYYNMKKEDLSTVIDEVLSFFNKQ